PSFPSGHSIESFGIAVALAHKFPDKKKALMDVAEKISDARVEMGVHYPSDKKVGKQIGEMIGRAYIREVMS
ncbi:MAG: phosphatase PAP2 family protein, partial [Candidatus Thermoplasmatota archaeon]|nr:phosphatase PAP2 family protein [Candidatus Thermoplasmatota archaeon]